LKIHEKN
jgi:transposase InsO family protein